VVVDNRGGANGLIAFDIVAKAPPDGYTLLLHSSTLWVLPLMQKVPYDPIKDFIPVTQAATSPAILVVHPSVAAKSVKELIVLAKANPGTLNYASGTAGGTGHLAAELLNSMAGVKIVRVPYKGTGAAINDLISGQVQVMFANAATVTPHIKSGKLRALAITTAEPSPQYPALPTIATALPGYEAVAPYGIFAPAKTPMTIIKRLNQEIVRIISAADVKEKFLSVGVETVGNSPGEFAAKVKSDIVKWGKVIKDVGIRAD
jgi:tripartite-type tricarboxylate transporter receptor subunit TctC